MQIWVIVFVQFQSTMALLPIVQVGVPCLCLYFLMAWSIYGFNLNSSPENNCNLVEVDQGWYSLMVFLLCIGTLCICTAAIFTCVIPFLVVSLFKSGGSNGADSSSLINQLGREKFDTSKYKYDSSCQICLQDYVETDDVTKLRCNDKHYFHTHCIEDWIKSGHPDCPFCREKITEEKEEEEDVIFDAPNMDNMDNIEASMVCSIYGGTSYEAMEAIDEMM